MNNHFRCIGIVGHPRHPTALTTHEMLYRWLCSKGYEVMVEQQIAQEFDEAARFFDEIKARYFTDDDAFCERSWGMSHDYHIAVKHGSTMVRVGTTIFGPRIY